MSSIHILRRTGGQAGASRILRRTGGQAGASRIRRIAPAALAAVALAATAAPAHANLFAVGPVDPATQAPAWFQDTNQLKLGLCLDGPPLCLTSAADFAQPNGEGFYFQAGATIPIGSGSAKLTLAQEATNTPGGPGAFMRVRVDLIGATPNATYAVTHPFGNVTVDTDATGRGRSVVDTGCPLGPCASFANALAGEIGPFLTWTPDPALPANHIGDNATPHTVTGGTNGNSFTVVGPGGGTTNLFTVAGKLAGPPVPVINDPAGVEFGSSTVGAPVDKTITLTSFGVPDPAAGASNVVISAAPITGAGAAAYSIVGQTCGGVVMPSGQSCTLTVRFNPSAPGTALAQIDVQSNAAPGVDHIGLLGTGVAPAAAVAGAGAQSRLAIQSLRTTHRMSRARVLRRGLRLTMRLPQGTEVVKIAVHRVRRGKVERRTVWQGFRVASKTGLFRLRLDSRTLRQRLKAGLYQVNVTPGLSRHDLGRTTTTRVRITRR